MPIQPPDPPLSDGVVTLRPWGEEGDVEAIAAACDDPEIAMFLDELPSPYGLQDAKDAVAHFRQGWADGSATNFAITEDGRVLGSVGVKWIDPDQGVAEVGYWVAAEGRGRGLCTRAVRLVSRWVLVDRAAQRLQLRAEVQNLASRKVAEKAGFTEEGTLRSSKYNPRLGRRMDFVMYSLLPDELNA